MAPTKRPPIEELPNPAPGTKADEGRAFFVSVIDRSTNRHALLAGPYETFGAAAAKKPAAMKAAEPGDPFAEYAYGICQSTATAKPLFGRL